LNHHLAPYRTTTQLPAFRLAKTPRYAKWVGRLLLLAFVLTPVVLLFVPWAQTLNGRGQVIAFDPQEREQLVTARVTGTIAKWYVQETDRVATGDPLVDLQDNDPEFGTRLKSQREYLRSRKVALVDQSDDQKGVVQAQIEAKLAAVEAAEAGVNASMQAVEATRKSLEGAQALEAYERVRHQRFTELYKNPIGGLETELNVREALNRWKRSEADIARIKEEIARGVAAIKQSQAGVKKADADGKSAVATANGNLARVEQDLFSLGRDLQVLDTQIDRYEARFIRSPCDGIVLRIEPDSSQVGQAVKEGQVLAVIVPETTRPVVALYLDGVDAPLVRPDPATGEYPTVRLQFEGWPAIQFGPAPDYSFGTFGGRIIRIDPMSNEKGQYRVLVEEEPREASDAWPAREFLRQGNQAQGFVFLRQVPLGYELWRRLNGFPPMSPPLRSDGGDKGAKPPKVKVK